MGIVGRGNSPHTKGFMKLKYVGTSKKMTIGFPLQAVKAKIKNQIVFLPGAEVELSDEDGQKLLDVDAEILKPSELSPYMNDLIGTPRLQRQKDGNYRFQKGFINAEEVIREKEFEKKDEKKDKKTKKKDKVLE